MGRDLKSVCVYCGSADHLRAEYLDAAYALGQFLAQSGIHTVYGAGKTGLMGKLADGALNAGGKVTGVVPRNLFTPVLIHTSLTVLEVVDDIHIRKARMSELADGFIALPGGYGTFDELFETLTWSQIGLHSKPVGILNVSHYFDPLLSLVANAWQEGFIYPGHENLLLEEADPRRLIEKMKNYQPPGDLEKWVNRDE
ncbi:MAG: TIGR00730 family Rossman fold protein [Anaerolineaceae bacterium]